MNKRTQTETQTRAHTNTNTKMSTNRKNKHTHTQTQARPQTQTNANTKTNMHNPSQYIDTMRNHAQPCQVGNIRGTSKELKGARLEDNWELRQVNDGPSMMSPWTLKQSSAILVIFLWYGPWVSCCLIYVVAFHVHWKHHDTPNSLESCFSEMFKSKA